MPTPYTPKAVTISLRSRIVVKILKWTLKPMIRLFGGAAAARIVRNHIRMSGQWRANVHGQAVDWNRYLGGVPGPILGDLERTDQPIVLYLHGGGFLIPAVPRTHLNFLADLCRDLGAAGFMPDYRLAPMHKYPAALDDCERAYRALLDLGFDPSRIVLAGESAGGNLTLGLLHRLRRHGLPMPACAIPISPITEMARAHWPLSRALNFHRDPLIPLHTWSRMQELYVGERDHTDPELSPIYADPTGFPPLFFLAAETEVLRDDSLIMARQAEAAGVDVKIDIWPVLPHAFPLFTAILPEAHIARREIAEYAAAQLARRTGPTPVVARAGTPNH